MNEEGTAETNQNHRSSWLIFAVGAVFFLLLCIKGGSLSRIISRQQAPPTAEFILVFALIWGSCIGFLLILPRRLSNAQISILLLAMALLCRLLMLPHELWVSGETCSRFSGNPPAVRLIIILFDLGTIFFLLKLLEYRCLSLRWAVLYAFNPVILFSFAGQARPDAVLLFFMLGTLCCYDTRHWKQMYLLAGLAFHAGHASVFILPLLASRKNIRHLWVLAAAMALPPVMLFMEPGFDRIYEFWKHFDAFSINGPVYELIQRLFFSAPTAASFCRTLFCAAWLFGLVYFHPGRSPFHRDDPASGIFFILGSLMIFSPTAGLWNLAWIMPFIALRPNASWMILCLSISAGFADSGLLSAGQRQLPIWVQCCIWMPFFLLIIRNIWLFWMRCLYAVPPVPVETLSVIIPARNENRRIAACISAVQQDSAVTEIIVVDGGSEDGTPEKAEQLGAQLVRHAAPPEKGGGRGGQILAGLKKAQGDLIVIVHADTQVPPVFSDLIRLMNRQPMLIGGSLGSVFNGDTPHLRLLETANDFRAACLDISFGDQVQFFRRQPAADRKLFPDIPLMEDVELSLRLCRLGRQSYLFGPASVSGRKWQTGVTGRTMLIICLFWVYMWRRLWQKPDTLKMYRRYYDG